MKKLLTLCIVHSGDRVLLGMKKRGFGAGKWNGFGGKVNPGESIEGAAARELMEEAGVEAEVLDELGILEFSFRGKQDVLEVHVYKARTIKGEPHESDEMQPAWFAAGSIPFDAMWPDDRYWMPLFLADKKFKGIFLFDESDAILEGGVNEINGK